MGLLKFFRRDHRRKDGKGSAIRTSTVGREGEELSTEEDYNLSWQGYQAGNERCSAHTTNSTSLSFGGEMDSTEVDWTDEESPTLSTGK
jgi:hypothetical protein